MKWSKRKRKNKLGVVTHSKKRTNAEGWLKLQMLLFGIGKETELLKREWIMKAETQKQKEPNWALAKTQIGHVNLLLSREGVSEKRNKNTVVFA